MHFQDDSLILVTSFLLAVTGSLSPHHVDLPTGLPECSHGMATGFFHWVIQEKEQGVNFSNFYELGSEIRHPHFTSVH